MQRHMSPTFFVVGSETCLAVLQSFGPHGGSASAISPMLMKARVTLAGVNVTGAHVPVKDDLHGT
jgi:hypothetical protein